MLELVSDGAIKAGDSERKSVQGEGKVVGFVGEGSAEGVFDAASGGEALVY